MKPRGDGGAADGTDAGAAGELRRHCFSLRRLWGVRVAPSRRVWVGAAPGGVRPRNGAMGWVTDSLALTRQPLRADTPRHVPFRDPAAAGAFVAAALPPCRPAAQAARPARSA
ncbi:hypothetical protein GCM10010383_44180 [Streptomyces lomondensis]|uniref:Uncharacterized protein n=1 Tax=Streptomyces lomondensis TaxID=68229 RepID=A0ABQ2XBQ2_9ACTN|nr:hypothetical protein GCM10010383_44180 [Streptomyces lomondensis]